MGDWLRDAAVVVTGGTGFLGSHLVRRLVTDGARVHLIVRADSPFERLTDVRDRITSTVADLTDGRSLDESLRGARPDIVFHLAGATAGRGSDAGTEPADRLFERACAVNLGGTLSVLFAVARGAPAARVIRTGGLAEYGAGPLPFREDQREQPVSPYAASQVAATQVGHAAARHIGVSVTTVRPALTYGPAQSDRFFIPALIAARLEGRPFTVTAGSHTRDLVYVDDVVDALMRAAAARDLAGQVVNAGSGREHRMGDVARLIARLAGGTGELQVDDSSSDPGDLPRLVCDPERARLTIGWTARTPLEDGLERTIAWHRSRRSATAPSAPRSSGNRPSRGSGATS